MPIIKRFAAAALLSCIPMLSLADIKVFATQAGSAQFNIVANNTSPFPYTVITSLRGENIDTSGWPKAFVVNPQSQYIPGSAKIADPSAKANLLVNATYMPGDIRKQPTSAVVRFPWRKGEEHIISQAYGSKLTTHADGFNEQAIDIGMDVGTPVLAAEGGKVVQTITNRVPGQKVNGDEGGNTVVVLHQDGSLGLYAHLSAVMVKEGQNVTAGQTIALSGNTGVTTGPHLHFEVATVVFANGTVKLRAIPVRFSIPGYTETIRVQKNEIWRNGRT